MLDADTRQATTYECFDLEVIRPYSMLQPFSGNDELVEAPDSPAIGSVITLGLVRLGSACCSQP